MDVEISNENKLLYIGAQDFEPNRIFIITTSYNVTNMFEKKSFPLKDICSIKTIQTHLIQPQK